MEPIKLTAKEVSSLNMFADAWAAADSQKVRLKLLTVMERIPQYTPPPTQFIIKYLRDVGAPPAAELAEDMRGSPNYVVRIFAEAILASIRCREARAERRKGWGL
jgi:hypothetical protein